MAVVKANAYGHGLIKTVNALADYADAFAVSRISEAVSIRKIGVSKPVLLLGGILDDKEAGQVAELGLWTRCTTKRKYAYWTAYQSGKTNDFFKG